MTLQIDPEGHEITALQKVAGSFAGRQVLEIGCGDGRLTNRFAAEADRVVAIDPNQERIVRAQASLPDELHRTVRYVNASLEDFYLSWRFSTRQRFDRALLSWSL